MLDGIEETSINTIRTIKNIKVAMDKAKHEIKSSSYYSKDLLECIFAKPYTTSNDIQERLGVARPTATKYLDHLSEIKLMKAVKNKGMESKYYNINLIKVLKNSIK